jgi:hypothetical protein
MYIKIENNKPVGHPIIEENLRALLPTVSLPQTITAEHLTGLGFAIFKETEKPVPGKFQKIEEDVYDFDGLEVTQKWKLVNMSDDEKQEFLDNLLFETNSLINSLLAASDWTELPSNQERKTQEWKDAWAEYRRKLRQIKNQPEYPLEIVLPAEPFINTRIGNN